MTSPQHITGSRVGDLCRDLIRIGSVNDGTGSGPGERAAAEYVAAVLTGLGLDPVVVESAPGRANVIARVAGADRTRPALLVHGHLDVVPAAASDWSVPPFEGEVRDGFLWGRGAIDMLHMDAIVLATLEQRLASGRPPARDLCLVFTADEEAGGRFGAHWLVQNHRAMLEGCSDAIGEVGGFSVTLGDRRLYLIETAEKGIAWLRLTARGRAGHGSMENDDNAVVHLADAMARIGHHSFPVTLRPALIGLLREAAAMLDLPFDSGAADAPEQAERVVRAMGAIAKMIGPTLRSSARPTMLDAGYKVNVIPGTATGHVDGRFLPGEEAAFLASIDDLLGPHVQREHVVQDIALETSFDGALVDVMTSSLLAHDPDARVAPYMFSGGTDAKAFSSMGMRCFGFAPLRLPADLDYAALFHGVDERVPLDALTFGVGVFDTFLDAC